MEDKLQHFECEDCGAEFALKTDMDIDPAYCPYCGEVFVPFINISNIDEDLFDENSGRKGEG